MPVERLENGSWPHPARLPLGAGWSGHCTAPGHEAETPAQDVLEAFCNLGYASGCCWTPTDRVWDAVRFAVSAPPDAASRREAGNKMAEATPKTADVLFLQYVCERDHLPVEYGELEFVLSRAAWRRQHSNPSIQKMAECFLESYLKRKV